MPVVHTPTIRWGVSGTPWTHDIDIHQRELGLLDFRHNWCRQDPAGWSTESHNAGSWTLENNAALAKEIMSRGGRFVEVLVDRQQVLGGEGNDARMLISTAIATWNTPKLTLLREEIREVRAAMPTGTYGEVWNGDEFGPDCGFPWDPMRDDFWKALGLSMPKGSTIKSRFTRFGNEVAAIWADPAATILRSSHVYMYPDNAIRNRKDAKVHPICTEVGVFESHMAFPEQVVRLQNALIANGVTWAFWHQPWPGNPGDGGAFQSGNKFMYDKERYWQWLSGRANPTWPGYEGVMLREAASALQAVMRA